MRVFIILLAVIYHINGEKFLTVSSFANALNKLSFELLKQRNYSHQNVIYSPLSIAMASGMLLLGAENQTRTELLNLLNIAEFVDKDTKVHKHFKELLEEYKKMNIRKDNPRKVSIEVANLAMVAEGRSLKRSFVDALKSNYESNVETENFVRNGDEIKKKINKFVKERTHDLIPELLKEPLDPLTLFALMNTIYFKGEWIHRFSRVYENQTFYNADHTTSNVKMMKKSIERHNYYENDKLALTELKYDGDVSMFIILPKERYGLAKQIETLNYDDVLRQTKLNLTAVRVKLPKFRAEHDINLMEVLPKMGANIENALRGVNPSISLTSAIHKAKINTHENGTEAAAVTLLIDNRSGHNFVDSKEFVVDHPFAFIIRDMKSRVNLFVGVINDFQ